MCTFIVARMVLEIEHFLFLTPKHTILKKHCRTLATYIFVNSQWIFCFNDSFCRARDQLSKMVQNFIVALMVPEKEQFFIEPFQCISRCNFIEDKVGSQKYSYIQNNKSILIYLNLWFFPLWKHILQRKIWLHLCPSEEKWYLQNFAYA